MFLNEPKKVRMPEAQESHTAALRIWWTFSWKGMKWTCHFKKCNCDVMLPMINLNFQPKITVLEISICHHELGNFSVLKNLCWYQGYQKCDFLIIPWKEFTFERLGDLYNSVNYYFPNNKWVIISNHALLKGPSK